jgi:hypothetical protein
MLSFLQDASVVVVQPLTPQQVIDYLIYRFPDSSIEEAQRGPTRPEPRWIPVRDELVGHPNGVLATILNTPWRLFAAVTAYQDPRTVPRELVELANGCPDELNAALLDKLIPAVMGQHPPPYKERFESADAIRWLRTLAVHLAWKRDQGFSGTDLYLHTIWQIAGSRAPRYLHATAIAAILAVGGVIAFLTDYQMLKDVLPLSPIRLAVPYSLLILAVCGVAKRPNILPRRNDYRRLIYPGKRTLKEFGAGLMCGLVFGLFGGSIITLLTFAISPFDTMQTTDSGVALVFGFALGLVFGLAFGLTAVAGDYPQALTRPSTLLREDLGSRLLDVLAGAFVFGVAVGLIFAYGDGSAIGLAYGLAYWPVGAFAGVLSSYAVDRYGTPLRNGFSGKLARVFVPGLVGVLTLFIVYAIASRDGVQIEPINGNTVVIIVTNLLMGVLAFVLGIAGVRAVAGALHSPTALRRGLVIKFAIVLAVIIAAIIVLVFVMQVAVELASDFQFQLGTRGGIPRKLIGGLAGVAAFGLTVTFAGVLALSGWIRCKIATMLVARHRELPSRLGVFLDWAYDAGLLKLSGISCQFRHLELQQWLESHEPQPGYDYQEKSGHGISRKR